MKKTSKFNFEKLTQRQQDALQLTPEAFYEKHNGDRKKLYQLRYLLKRNFGSEFIDNFISELQDSSTTNIQPKAVALPGKTHVGLGVEITFKGLVIKLPTMPSKILVNEETSTIELG